MTKIALEFKQVRDGRHGVPSYETEGAAGFDLKCYIDETHKTVTLRPGQRRLFMTGIAVAVPLGFELQIRPRSGNALKKGLGVVNSPGTIDSDYRGEIGVILINHSDEEVTITDGDRIAQAVLCPIFVANFMPVNELPPTRRGAGGFGSTGA